MILPTSTSAAIDPGNPVNLPGIPGATLYPAQPASYSKPSPKENTHIPFLVSTEPTIVTESKTSQRTRCSKQASVVEKSPKGTEKTVGRSWKSAGDASPDPATANLRHHFQLCASIPPSTNDDLPLPPLKTSRTMAANGLYNIYRLAIPVATGAMLVNASLYDVRGGTRAVIFDRLSGVQEKVVNEGTHFLVPWLQRAIIYDVRTKPRNISTTTGSKDLQMVSLTLRVLHRPEVPKLPLIYQVSFLPRINPKRKKKKGVEERN